MNKFKMMTNLTPKGDQVRSIKELTNNIKNNIKTQVLLGATGTGKTFTIANVINKIQQNTLVIVHNKTLAAQLYGEFKTLFPENNVEYYISYFDFYQPEAYIPRTDTYIEKSTKTNQEIEMMRLSTINSLSSKTPTIVIASVASIYASVSPHDFQDFKIVLKKDNIYNLKQLQYDLVKLQYQRNNIELKPGTFIVKGDIVDIAPGYADDFFIRINFTYNKITSITVLDSTTKKLIRE
jgi:excinuclease ABC subunit B